MPTSKQVPKPESPASVIGTGGPYKIDLTPPVVTITLSPDPGENWTNKDVNYRVTASDALSGIKSVTGTPSTFGTFTTTGYHTVTGNAEDVAGNTASASRSVKIDKVPPRITYKFEDSKFVYNTNKNRWESLKDYAKFSVNIIDLGKGTFKSGLHEVKVQVVKDINQNIDGSATNLNSKISLMESGEYVDIPIPTDMLKEAGKVYLKVYAKDKAGNELKSDNYVTLTKGNKVGNAYITPIEHKYVGESDEYSPVRNTPSGELFINSSDIVTTTGGNSSPKSALYITNVYDVNWQKTMPDFVITTDGMAAYMNKQNDTIGLGYRVDFAFDTVGFGTDNGDAIVIKPKFYGTSGNTYKELTNPTVPNDRGQRVSLDNKFKELTFIRNDATFDNTVSNAKNLKMHDYKFKGNNIDSRVVFNYYLPANTKFNMDGKEYTGNEIVVVFDIYAYKYYDMNSTVPKTNAKLKYTFINDSDVTWGSTGTTGYGRMKTSSHIMNGKGQTYIYDAKLTALSDISGGHSQN